MFLNLCAQMLRDDTTHFSKRSYVAAASIALFVQVNAQSCFFFREARDGHRVASARFAAPILSFFMSAVLPFFLERVCVAIRSAKARAVLRRGGVGDEAAPSALDLAASALAAST